MKQNDYLNIDVNHNRYQPVVLLLIFIVGLFNSTPFIRYMGYNSINRIISVLFYLSLFFLCTVIILDFLYNRRKLYRNSFTWYWVILFISVSFKFALYFIQSPRSIFPGGSHFSNIVTHMTNLLLIWVLIINIKNIRSLKQVIWGFGLGALFSAFIPLVFFPEMIGSRTIHINNYVFTGGFWNSAVISYMSVGWLLVAIAILEKSKIKRWILLISFFLLLFAGLAGLSRATLLSLLTSVFVYLLTSRKFVRYLRTILISIVAIFLLSAFFQDVMENFGNRLDGGLNIREESRVEIWKDYIEDIPSYFIIGESEGNYKKYSATYQGPHSVILNWFVQFGILAVLGFLCLILGLFNATKVISKKYNKNVAPALYAWIIAYLSIAMINETGFDQLSVFGGMGIILAWGNIISSSYSDCKE